jgi:hypothetical protein
MNVLKSVEVLGKITLPDLDELFRFLTGLFRGVENFFE